MKITHFIINDFSGKLGTNSDCSCIKGGESCRGLSGDLSRCFPIETKETRVKLGPEEVIINRYLSWPNFAHCQ